MTVTVEQIMNLEEIAQVAKLVAGHGGIKNQITFVTISEAPDFYQWVSGGEFVLSTLYAFKDHPEWRAPAYRELAQRGIAAIGIKTRRFVDEIPAELIQIADEYNLPLFEIERETKFRQIIQAITAELNNQQTNLLLEVERHYKELAEVALVSGDFEKYLRTFGRRRKCGVFCFRSDFRLLGSYPGNIRDDEAAAIYKELIAKNPGDKRILMNAVAALQIDGDGVVGELHVRRREAGVVGDQRDAGDGRRSCGKRKPEAVERCGSPGIAAG